MLVLLKYLEGVMCNKTDNGLLEQCYENLKVCKICNRIFENKNLRSLKISLHQHLKIHNITVKEYYQQYFKILTTQKCTKCNIIKPLDEFYKRKDQDCYRQDCKKCNLKDKIIYLINHKEERKEYNKQYFKKNRLKFVQYIKNKRHNNLNYRIATRLSNQLRKTLTSQKIIKNIKTLELLGCTYDEFKLYFEKLFQIGMTWDNHGFGEDKWHFDHIIPISSFDLTDLEQQKKCFHYTNLQPLWQRDNLEKGKKLNYFKNFDKKYHK